LKKGMRCECLIRAAAEGSRRIGGRGGGAEED
jgi:hypothetical protein